MGGKERFSVPLRAVTLATGNQLTYTDDLFRRSVICELFTPVQYDQRVLPEDAIDLTEEWLAEEGNRKRVLAALWSLTKHAEAMDEVRPAVPARKIGSFEGWCRVVPRIVMHGQFGDPTEKPPVESANPLLQEARDLTRLALDQLVDGARVKTVMLQDLVPIARKAGLFVEALGNLEDVLRDLDNGRGKWKQVEEPEYTAMGTPCGMTMRAPTAEEKRAQAAEWVDRSMATKFGMLLKKLVNGLLFADSQGRSYTFGSREGARKGSYLCTLKPMG